MNEFQRRMDAAFKKMAAIRKAAEAEKRALTDDEIAQRAALKAEIDLAKRQWDDQKAEEELRAELYGSGGGALTVADDATITAPDAPIYRGSNASVLGAQLLDIRTMSRPDVFDGAQVREARSRLENTEKRNTALLEAQARKESRAASSGGFTVGVPTDGGFFLQGETAVELMTTGFNNSEVLSRCSSRTLGAGSQFVEIIGIDEKSRADGSRGGGVRVYTDKELGEITASKTQFNKTRIEPKKLTGLYHASGEMVRNVTFLGQEMRQLFGGEFAFKCQNLVLRGSGAGEALGILNAPCKISVAKEANQIADTIVTQNILNMEAALIDEGPGVVYLVNRETKPQISTLSLSVGTGGVLVPLYQTVPGQIAVDAAGRFYQGKRQTYLNGIPCITIEQASALGDEGDISLADLSQYITANKGDINEAMSIHVNFIYDQETFRFIYYFDGQPRFASSVTPFKGKAGAKVGPFITLKSRA